jgi:hypothetical protein
MTRSPPGVVAALLSSVLLVGCGDGKDSSVCTPILEPTTPASTDASIAAQRDADWQRKRADACVHRQAYRLATSGDPAATVAMAAIEACEPAVSHSAAINAHWEMEQGYIPAGAEVIARAAEIKANYERFALLKVVEGRAGGCKA